MERYIKEYASAKIKETIKNKLMREELKYNTITRIKGVLTLRENGLVTANETIKIILEA